MSKVYEKKGSVYQHGQRRRTSLVLSVVVEIFFELRLEVCKIFLWMCIDVFAFLCEFACRVLYNVISILQNFESARLGPTEFYDSAFGGRLGSPSECFFLGFLLYHVLLPSVPSGNLAGFLVGLTLGVFRLWVSLTCRRSGQLVLDWWVLRSGGSAVHPSKNVVSCVYD